MDSNNGHSTTTKEIWDLPTRLFHWVLVITITGSWLSRDVLHFQAHLFFGYLLFFLLLFRILWGFIGATYSQFRHFFYPWQDVKNHLQQVIEGEPSQYDGHNPAGSWMIFLLLGMLLLITITGIITLGGEEQSGPLQTWVSISTGIFIHSIHQILAWLLLALISIHLAGVLIEQWISRRSLIRAMMVGHHDRNRTSRQSQLIAIIITLIFPALSYSLSTMTEDDSHQIYTAQDFTKHAAYPLWQEECGGCHSLHHPSLLPARSWNRMMAQQQDHFDEDLALDSETSQQIRSYLIRFNTTLAHTEAAWRISDSIQANETPLQITNTLFWKETHQEIPSAILDHPSTGGRAQCDRCHQDAVDGTFRNRAIQIPDEANI